MKKFKFSLDTVLSYKQQVLDALQGEYAEAAGRVRAQELVLEGLWQEYRDCNEEYRRRAAEGLPITEALMYQSALRASELNIQVETQRLKELEDCLASAAELARVCGVSPEELQEMLRILLEEESL